MANEIPLPPLGESISEATIVRWLKAPGDLVARDEEFAVVSTDKVETELPSPSAGTLLHRLFGEGDTVPVGEIMAVLGEPGETWTPSKRTSKPASTPTRSASRRTSTSARRSIPAQSKPPVRHSSDSQRPSNAAYRATGDAKLFISPVVRRLAWSTT